MARLGVVILSNTSRDRRASCAARLALCGGVPGLRADPLELQFISRLLRELKQELLGGAAVALSHRVPKIKLPVVVSEALDERRFLQSLQVIFGGEVTENFLSPALERVGGSFQRGKGRAAFRELHRAVFSGPLVHVLKQVAMDGAIVGGVETALQGMGAQLLGALTRRFVLEGAQRSGMGETDFVFEDGRVRPKVGVPLVHPTNFKRVRGGAYAR